MLERTSCCIVGWQVAYHRTEAVIQAMVEDAPQAVLDYSADFSSYSAVLYKPDIHLAITAKRQTYGVEADTAELRHSLVRLARRSRCFSPAIAALRRAIKLCVYAWNRRQLDKRPYPNYPAQLIEFV